MLLVRGLPYSLFFRELLKSQFGQLAHDEATDTLALVLDDALAIVHLRSLHVESENAALKERVDSLLRRFKLAVFPVSS